MEPLAPLSPPELCEFCNERKPEIFCKADEVSNRYLNKEAFRLSAFDRPSCAHYAM